ncbi:MAG: HesA/MoeB/ThiF family protein [Chlorobi bacterium]|nr:HesA/MoeB/ThiF family protein [Chlorobiota bacterium]
MTDFPELEQKELRRYKRHIMLPQIGEAGQKKLKNAKVLVVGAGGLGCPVLQYLSAAGVGTLGIMDDDFVDESNLQRQVLYGLNDLGKLKAIIARERLTEKNPLIQYRILNIRLHDKNVLEIVPEYDIVVDATDNYPSRYLINDVCVTLGKPMVYGAIYQFEGHVSVLNYKGGPTYRCLFPEAPRRFEAPEPTETGVIGVLPGVIGTLQATEVVKMILGRKEILAGKLLIVDILKQETRKIAIPLNPDNLQVKFIPAGE